MSVIGRVVSFLVAAIAATWDPANKGVNTTLSNGNLTASNSTAGADTTFAAIGKTSGKWYFEVTVSSSSALALGVANGSQTTSQYPGQTANAIGYGYNGLIYYNGGTPHTYSTYTSGDVIGIAYDAGAGTVTFYKNGVSQGSPTATLTGTIYPVVGSLGSASYTVTANFGASPFIYTPPSGYQGLI